MHQKPRKDIISYTDSRINVLSFQLQVYFWLINWWKHANILPPRHYSVLNEIIHSILACARLFLKGLNYFPTANKVLSTYCQSFRQDCTETAPATEQQQRMMLKKGRPSSSPRPNSKRKTEDHLFPLTIVLNPQIAIREENIDTLRNLHTTYRHSWHGHRPICNTTEEWSAKNNLKYELWISTRAQGHRQGRATAEVQKYLWEKYLLGGLTGCAWPMAAATCGIPGGWGPGVCKAGWFPNIPCLWRRDLRFSSSSFWIL